MKKSQLGVGFEKNERYNHFFRLYRSICFIVGAPTTSFCCNRKPRDRRVVFGYNKLDTSRTKIRLWCVQFFIKVFAELFLKSDSRPFYLLASSIATATRAVIFAFSAVNRLGHSGATSRGIYLRAFSLFIIACLPRFLLNQIIYLFFTGVNINEKIFLNYP